MPKPPDDNVDERVVRDLFAMIILFRTTTAEGSALDAPQVYAMADALMEARSGKVPN